MARTFAGGTATDLLQNTSFQPNYTQTSWQFWMNVAAYDATARRLFDTNDATNLGQSVNMSNAGTLVYQYNRSTTAGVWTIPTPSAAAWHHIVITYDGSATTNNPVIYVDGVSQTVTTAQTPVGTLGAGNVQLYVGNRSDTLRVFNGSMEEAAVWNVILTGANVTSLYNAGAGALATSVQNANLKGYWQLCGGSPEADASTGAHPLTVSGTTVSTSHVGLCPVTSLSITVVDQFGRIPTGTVLTAVSVVMAGTRDPALQPFAKFSPWNVPIGSLATYTPIVWPAGLTDQGVFVDSGVSGNTQNPVGVYIAQNSDPIRTFNVNNFFGTNGPINTAYFGGTNGTGATPNFSRHAPNNMTANTTDGMLVIIAPSHLTCMSGEGWNNFVQLPATGSLGTLTSGLTINEDLKGPGWNGTANALGSPQPWPCIAINSGDEATPYPSSNPTSGSAFYSPGNYTNASGTSMLGGMIRAGEMKNGIFHALQAITSPLSKNSNAPGGTTFVWPATTSDGGGSGAGYGTTGNAYLGCLFAIPLSTNLNALTWNHVEAKNIAIALQQYGAYNCDSGGGNASIRFIEFRTEIAVVLNNEVAWQNDAGGAADLTQIEGLIQIVSNSYAGGAGTTAFGVVTALGGQPRTGYRIDNGDGTLSAPFLPSFDSTWGGGDGRAS